MSEINVYTFNPDTVAGRSSDELKGWALGFVAANDLIDSGVRTRTGITNGTNTYECTDSLCGTRVCTMTIDALASMHGLSLDGVYGFVGGVDDSIKANAPLLGVQDV